jgi:hypothetical protein
MTVWLYSPDRWRINPVLPIQTVHFAAPERRLFIASCAYMRQTDFIAAVKLFRKMTIRRQNYLPADGLPIP